MKCIAEIPTWSNRSANASTPRYPSIKIAVGDILAHHPYCIARDGTGQTVTAATPDSQYVARNGVYAVIWKDEADRVKGDLSKAQAVIRAR